MKQIIVGGNSDALNVGADEYNNVSGGRAWTPTSVQCRQVMPTAGTFSNLSVELSGVPGTNPYVFTLCIDGVASALTVSVATDGTTAIDTEHTVAVTAGQCISLKQTRPSGNPGNTPSARWSVMFEGDTDGESVLFAVVLTETGATDYCPLMTGMHATNNTEANAYNVLPIAGTIKKLYVWMNADPGTDPDAYQFKLRVNGADSDDGDGSPLACTITADAVAGNDTTHEIAVSQGALCNWIITPLNTPGAAAVAFISCVFVSGTNGESLILGMSSDTPANSQTEYNYLTTTIYTNLWDTTEVSQGGQAPTPSMVLKKLYVKAQNAPGAGGSGDKWNFTLRAGGGDSALTAEILETATTGSDSLHSVTCAAYDDLAMKAAPTSTPTTGMFYWGLVCYLAPPAVPAAYPSIGAKMMMAGAL